MLENDPMYMHFKKGWEVEEGKLWKKKQISSSKFTTKIMFWGPLLTLNKVAYIPAPKSKKKIEFHGFFKG